MTNLIIGEKNLNSKYIRTTALTGITAFSLADLLYISTTEKLRDFIAKTAGTPIPPRRSLYDVLPPNNALYNGGFETGDKTGWGSIGTGTWSVQGTVMVSGVYAAQLTPSANKSFGITAPDDVPWMPCHPGQRRLVCAWMKADANITNSHIRIVWMNLSGTIVGYTESVDYGGNYDWTFETLLATAPAGAYGMEIYIYFTSGGTAGNGYVDDAANPNMGLHSELYDLLTDGTYGLSALNTDLDALLSRLTATRAGYLDNLSGGAVALASVCTETRLSELAAANIPADIDTLKTRVPAEVTQRAKSSFKVVEKFFADSTRVTITGTAGNVTIKSNFSISLIPTDVTLDYVHIYVFSQVTENTNAASNKVNGAQNIQIQRTVGGTWTNCVSILDDALRVPGATRDMGRLLGAPVDCKAEVTGNGSYNLQWTSARMDLDSVYLDDVFFIVELGFH